MTVFRHFVFCVSVCLMVVLSNGRTDAQGKSIGLDEDSTKDKVQLTRENLPQWRDHILPGDGDLAWMQIPWLTTFADGIAAANRADKPLLLWVMNGHPLGCT